MCAPLAQAEGFDALLASSRAFSVILHSALAWGCEAAWSVERKG